MQLHTAKKRLEPTSASPLPATAQSVAPQYMGQYLQAAVDREQAAPIDLSEAMRARMEAHFGRSFSQVRLVRSDLPRRLGAGALAQGNLIRFAPGAFSPDTEGGQRLLAHELSHVVQQSQGTGMDGIAGMPAYHPGVERAADAMARQALTGVLSPIQTFPIPAASQAPILGNGLIDRIRKWFAARREERAAKDAMLDQHLALRPWKIDEADLKGEGGNYEDVSSAVTRKREAMRMGQYDLRHISVPAVIEPKIVTTPVPDEELDANVKALRDSEDLQQLQNVFGNTVLRRGSFTSDFTDLDRLDLDKMKNRLIPMARMIRDFPELKQNVGNFKRFTSPTDYIMATDVVFNQRSGISWNPEYVQRGNSRAAMVRFVSTKDQNTIGTGPYDGTHELGHIVNMMLVKKTGTRYPHDNFEDAVTTNKIINRALARIFKSNERTPGKYPWITRYLADHGTPDARNANTPGWVDLGIRFGRGAPGYAAKTKNARMDLFEKYEQTSRYGASDPVEMFAEAFANVYEKGRGASVLNRKIVKEAWLELHPKAAARHKKLKRRAR